MEKLNQLEISYLINIFSIEKYQYHFFQMMRLLDSTNHNYEIILNSSTSVGFPNAEVTYFAKIENKIFLQLSFMGLYGVDSPLPHYFHRYTLHTDDISKRIRAFLNIFNNRIYWLFYLAWKKYHVFYDLHQSNNPYLNYLIHLSGNSLSMHDKREFSFAGLLGSKMRNVTSLKNMISEYFKDITVTIEQFVLRWLDIHETSDTLLHLGDNTMLGTKVLDRSGKINVILGPVCIRKINSPLFNKDLIKKLSMLIQRYLGPTLAFDIILKLDYANEQELYLQNTNVVLGVISWIGIPNPSNVKHSAILNYINMAER